jgi:alcohol dehydrogenase
MIEASLSETLANRKNPKIAIAEQGYFRKLELTDHEKVLILSSPSHNKSGTISKLLQEIAPRTTKTICNILPNPTETSIKRTIAESQPETWDTLIALGGGSVIDTAKIVSMFVGRRRADKEINLRHPKDQFESARACRLITVPTTAGTGSEVTQFATIWDDLILEKYSVSSHHLLPDLAILDSSLLEFLPPKIALYSCLDATAHCMETLWNKNRTKESIYFAQNGLKLIEKEIAAFSTNAWNIHVAGQLQRAALCGGLAISVSRTAISHSISYPLTAHLGIPHGLAVGFTLVAIYESLKDAELSYVEAEFPMERIVSQLKMLNLAHEIESYAKRPQILNLIDKMSSSERASNFILPISNDLIASILERSLTSE